MTVAKAKAKPGSGAELAELYPAPQVIAVKVRRSDTAEFDDAEVRVTEMDIRQIAQATRALAPISDAIKPTASFMVLAAEHPDEIFAALGVAIGWPAADVARLSGSSFGRVALAVWSANHDFFAQLLALLASGSTAMRPPANGAGETRSGISSAGAIATPPATPSASSTVQ